MTWDAILGFGAWSALISAVAGWWTSRKTLAFEREQFLRTHHEAFALEAALKALLSSERWQKRSLEAIKRRIGGYEDLELRKALVSIGAVRFSDDADIDSERECWGLGTRNSKEL